MATAMVSARPSMPTFVILGFMSDEFMRLLRWKVERRDPSRLRLGPLVAAKAMAHPRRLDSSPTLKRSFSSHKVVRRRLRQCDLKFTIPHHINTKLDTYNEPIH